MPYKYKPLRTGPDGDAYSPMQFEVPPPKPPFKAIALALFLLAVGTTLLSIGALMITGHLGAADQGRSLALIILGALTFLPGSYHVYIAYGAWKGYKGYSYNDIPHYDEE